MKNYKVIINQICIIAIKMLRPLLGPANCRYPIGCTQYAITQLQENRIDKACWAIIKRLVSCW